jgi:hypothetical protein
VVTLSVAGICKEVLTIVLSTLVFHDELTPINISGLCVTIFGIALYNYLKYRDYDVDPVIPTQEGDQSFNSVDNGDLEADLEMADQKQARCVFSLPC